MKIAKNSKCLMIGDSITDTGRDETGEPTPWAPHLGQGQGYVNLLNALIENQYPGHRIRIINKGVSGNTVLDLKSRWQTDVLDLTPNWLSVFIGVNDVWRQFDTPQKTETHISLEQYQKTLADLLTQSRNALDLEGLILISGFVVEKNPDDPFRAKAIEYGKAVSALAQEYNAIFIDAQAAIDKLLEHHHPTEIAWDRIHLNTSGHMAIALAILNALA